MKSRRSAMPTLRRQTTPPPTCNDQQINHFQELFQCMPSHILDGLLCSGVLLVINRDADGALEILEELGLLPDNVRRDPTEFEAVRELLLTSIDDILVYKRRRVSSDTNSDTTSTSGSDNAGEERVTKDKTKLTRQECIPKLRLEKLFPLLGVLTTRYGFRLPAPIVENLKELGFVGSINGITSTLQMYLSFNEHNINIVQVAYPYALHRLVTNPSGSDIVSRTVSAIARNPSGHIDAKNLWHALREASSMTGYSKASVIKDFLLTPGATKLLTKILSKDVKSRSNLIRNLPMGCAETSAAT